MESSSSVSSSFNATINGSGSNGSSGSSDASASVRVISRPPTPRMKTLDMGETCSFLSVDSNGCRAPRSCASCLAITGCMVSTIGQCVSPRDAPYDPSIEFRHAISENLVVSDAAQAQSLRAAQMWQFPAGTVRYCPASDTKCSECTRQNFWRANTSFPDSRFCVGENGACVCVDVCERRWYVQDDCSGFTSVTQMPSYYLTSDNLFDRLWRGLLSAGVFVAIVLLIMLRKKRVADRIAQTQREAHERREAARHARVHARSRALGVNAMTLSGWESHRRDLIDKETARLAGESDESKTGDLRDDMSNDGDDREIHSPRAGDEAVAAYVSLEESGPGNTSTRSTPTITTTTSASDPRLSGYNESTPSRQLLAPLSTRDL